MKKGISLIVLIITIIVMIVLAGVVIMTLSNTDMVGKSTEAVFKQDVKQYMSQLSMYTGQLLINDYKLDTDTINATSTTTPSITDMIPSMSSAHKTKFEVSKGELKYIGTDEDEAKWCADLGME